MLTARHAIGRREPIARCRRTAARRRSSLRTAAALPAFAWSAESADCHDRDGTNDRHARDSIDAAVGRWTSAGAAVAHSGGQLTDESICRLPRRRQRTTGTNGVCAVTPTRNIGPDPVADRPIPQRYPAKARPDAPDADRQVVNAMQRVRCGTQRQRRDRARGRSGNTQMRRDDARRVRGISASLAGRIRCRTPRTESLPTACRQS